MKWILLLITLTFFIFVVGYNFYFIKKNSEITTIPPSVQAMQLVEGFPDIPVYPQAQLVNSESGIADNQILYRATWTVEYGAIGEVMNWYTTNLEQMGWEVYVNPNELNGYGIQNASFIKGDLIQPLSLLQLSVISDNQTQRATIEISFPEPDNEKEVESKMKNN